MRRIAAIAAVLAFLGACTSGDSGCGSDAKKTDSGHPTAMSGGSGGGRGGSLGEGVSFQGLGKKQTPTVQKGAVPAQPVPSASGAPAAGPQAVICGGFPNLPGDCLRDLAFNAIKAKCCPTGYVERCEGIPGGARLTGSGCTASR